MDKNNEIYTKIEKCRGIIRQTEKELYDITIKSKNIIPEIEEIQNEISYLNGWMILRNDENIISIFLSPILSLMVIWGNGIIEPFPK